MSKTDRIAPHAEGAEYFAARSLRKGSVSWVLLVSLGVSYTISGDFSGWNYGMEHGGWAGLFLAFAVMGTMYACTVFGLAELASAIPTTGAGFGFARCALGRAGGFATGLALTIEYVCAPAAISTFIANYLIALGIFPGVDPFLLVVGVYVVFTAIHVIGVGEALKLMLVISGIAVVALVAFVVGAAGSFNPANLFDIAPTDALGASTLFPHGVAGVLASLPYGIWFFLGVEGVPLAAEEAVDPRRDMPRGLIWAMAVLTVTGLASLVFAAGAVGAAAMAGSDAPLVEALAYLGRPELAAFVNVAGLAGLVASFFSLMYAGSRQVFALARSGYLPSFLALTGTRKTPVAALLCSAAVGLALVAVMHDGALILNVAVFGACVSYALMNLSHIVLRRRATALQRTYLTPGGARTTTVALVLSCVAVVSTFFVDMVAVACVVAVYALGMTFFFVYSRSRLVSNAPEEEFARMSAAEAQLR
ncbi:ethanolamine permease [Eggerthellaceae bacterium zg-1084]|uniref:Ethanolamine permease n=1 Tax=Berryella wangjianweii TaxID=2734634 RepID=A0A6M8J173_9ACTN|nr:ethanolamine permease [Berryella wangjianweii]NPD31310.1 ethanolamine permease [Berryella wangjianweii]NPD32381.1 ethanolamine permease [Eggerthellaceae bacterium zg-997]QKF06851.1 ethanolamine permease [Berryella wangjianweii]